jgi:GxxExxY protein
VNGSAELNALTKQVIGAAIEVHRHLGPGLLESAYETCLAYELQQLNLSFERQKALPLVYKEIHLIRDTALICSWSGRWLWNSKS